MNLIRKAFCKMGIHQRQTEYTFNWYETPEQRRFPSVVVHFDVKCPCCEKVWSEGISFLFDDALTISRRKAINKSLEEESLKITTLEDAINKARKFKGDWYYLDVTLPAQKKAEYDKLKAEFE